MNREAYRYFHVPIPGGGYVTGFQLHRRAPGILYARTDIGGTYRYDPARDAWESLTEWAERGNLAALFPAAIALDDAHPDRLYIACGEENGGWKAPSAERFADANGKLLISEDRGTTFREESLPCYIHGNLPGRSTGPRLAVSPADPDTIFFASQRDGLFVTRDRGRTWRRQDICGERYLTLVWLSPDARTVVVGTAGVSTGSDRLRGHSLYLSRDGGESFRPLPQPENHPVAGSLYAGYVAQRVDFDGSYLFVTLANTGAHNFVRELGYSCDAGSLLGGRVIRYRREADGGFSDWEDITPDVRANGRTGVRGGAEVPERGDSVEASGTEADSAREDQACPDLPCGFGGIASCPAAPGLLAVSTLCKMDGDILYISRDSGANWERALDGLATGGLHFHTPYMKPEYNGGKSLIHWMSDVKFDPFDPDTLWFNTGTGVFVSRNFTGGGRSFADSCRGIEETVHLNLYSPPSGEAALIDVLGDLGGFAFTDLRAPCENSFADDRGNRYITCLNADYPDARPALFAVAARGNWTGETKGGVILTQDGGRHFERLPLPFGLSAQMDALCRGIERPNVNPGWVAVGADGGTIVYGLADGVRLPASCIAVTHDRGAHWERVRVFDSSGGEMGARESGDQQPLLKVYADRTDAARFYGFGEAGQFYVSCDRGHTFRREKLLEIPAADGVRMEESRPAGRAADDAPARAPGWQSINFGLVDCADKTEIRGDSGFAGDFYLALGAIGLWKLHSGHKSDAAWATRLTEDGDAAYRVGLGMLDGESGYIGRRKAIYICGTIGGVYGFFRSDDGGASWVCVNDARHRFGEINSIEGDSRVPGRFFIGSGSFGVLCGERAAANGGAGEMP